MADVDRMWREYRCPDCGGGWSITATDDGPAPAHMPCVHCAGVGALYGESTEFPDLHLDLWVEHDIQQRKNRKRPLEPTRQRCPFCDTELVRGVNESKEHVLAEWLREVPPLPEALQHLRTGEWRWTTDMPRYVNGAVWHSPPRRLPTKRVHELFTTVSVCDECNNKWMSHLEILVAPILSPVISGQLDRFPADSHLTLTRWLGKVMVAFERDDPTSAVATPAQIRDVRLGRAPRWSEVWVAKWATPEETMLRHVVLEARDWVNHVTGWRGSRTYVALGHVVLLMQTADRPGVDMAALGLPTPWVRLWPSTGTQVVLADPAISRPDVMALGG